MIEEHGQNESRGNRVWNMIMSAALAIPGMKVDRAGFLRSQLKPYCDESQIRLAIEERPANAGVPPEVIDKLANGCIKLHVATASGISFAAGLPGGWAMAGTIPADAAQFYWHILQLQQKLAYLYGWPDLLDNGEVDDETKYYITLFTGAMHGVVAANRAIFDVASQIAKQVTGRVPRIALTKTAWYPLIKQIAKWIGIRITKTSFARGAAKVVPIVGGVISAGVTAGTMAPMANRLKNHLRELPLAKRTQDGGDETRNSWSGAIPMPPHRAEDA